MLEELLAKSESKTLEFKENAHTLKSIWINLMCVSRILVIACVGFHLLFAFANETEDIVFSPSANGSTVTDIVEIYSFAQMVKEIDNPDALIFIDIDDTLIDFDMHIGCKQWRKRIKNTSLKSHHDGLTLYIAQQIPMVSVEQDTPTLIKELQRKGYYLFPLTARERDCWYDLDGIPQIDAFTHQALLNAQFNFEQTSRPPYFHYMPQDTFYRGIYFSKHSLNSEKMKGDTIKELLAPVFSHISSQEIKIYFIDDKREQCESVLSAIRELGIAGRIYWYRACETNHQDFDFAASLLQLENLLFTHTILSNQEASKELKSRGNPTAAQFLEHIASHLYSLEESNNATSSESKIMSIKPEEVLVDVIALSEKLCSHPIQGVLAYATTDNFLGRIVNGYSPDATCVCLLTRKAAHQLCLVQNVLNKQGLGLFIFDAFRPLRAVRDFASWYHQPVASATEAYRKQLHYPHLEKTDLPRLGYAPEEVSTHCFGHAVDLSLIDLNINQLCNMGTIFDYFDHTSHHPATLPDVIGTEAYHNRQLLTQVMEEFGFIPYPLEYWHFDYKEIELDMPADIAITPHLLYLNAMKKI